MLYLTVAISLFVLVTPVSLNTAEKVELEAKCSEDRQAKKVGCV